jgi:hypothetical protein
MEFESEEDQEESPGIVGQAELIRSYLAYVGRALKAHRVLALSVFVAVASISGVVVALLPANYHCEMKLTSIGNEVFEDKKDNNGLGGAREFVKRHDNLVALATRLNLVQRWEADRPPVMRWKDDMMARIRGGRPSEADQLGALVYLLDSRLSIDAQEITLTIGVDWPRPETAAMIVEAAEQSFLEARHQEEISTIQEKMSILEQHASTLREEIDADADQLQRLREEKLAEVNKAFRQDNEGTAPSATALLPPPRRVARVAPPPDEQLPILKDQLDDKKKSLAALEADRSRRLGEARAHLEEIKIRFTPAHPAVLAAEQSVANLSRESEQVTSLRGEIKQLEADIKDRTVGASAEGFTGGGGGALGSPSPASSAGRAEALPADIMKLLDSGPGLDPAISSHLSGAVALYSHLREEIRGFQVGLDTAQAAFNHRYRVLIPVQVPNRPTKTKAPVILGGGIAAAVMLAVLLAVITELRKGVIVEYWQVHQMHLPVLGELRFPPSSGE